MFDNILLQSDSYKFSHWLQYPPGSDGYFGYIEARGCERNWEKSVFFGLQIFIKNYLSKPFTKAHVDELEEFCKLHREPFNREGWDYILNVYKGYFPVHIKAVPEGKPIPLSMPLLTLECLDEKVFWCGSFLETCLLRSVWYGTTVSSLSWHCKEIIREEMESSCDDLSGLLFKLIDFGSRSVSSNESAGIGGCAHLVSFEGSDNVAGIWTANNYYNCTMAGFSIPAAEHSTITSWGREQEVDAYHNMLKQYGKPGAKLAVVSDSYDIYNACDAIWGEQLKQEVIDSEALLVIRPDSGEPEHVILKCIDILGNKFGFTTNSLGFKVLKNVRLLQGDGVNERSIRNILANLRVHGWSADNISFGMGGALLQGINRDTFKFAMKCSAIRVNGEWRDVKKDPITDSGKRSKAGRISLYHDGKDYLCLNVDKISNTLKWEDYGIHYPEVLKTVYEWNDLLVELIDSPIVNYIDFEEVRKNSTQR